VKIDSLRYVLITPARNEEEFIELTIQSVACQTVLPLKWVIVSDGSTDRTDEIVRQYTQHHEWIDFVRMPDRIGRHFGGKVACFNAGYARTAGLDFSVVGSLDADLSFGSGYFEFLLSRFAADSRLGVAGTPFAENGRTYDYRFSSKDHVSGACQLFRRECYKDIGGYVPLKGGGIDSVAVMTARMKGWRTQTYTEMVTQHHRPMGTGNGGGKLPANFRLGQRAYRLGWHPMWQVVRSLYQMTKWPYLVGGAALLLGYFYASVCQSDRPISKELVEFQRRDQVRRLRLFFGLAREPAPESESDRARVTARRAPP
jgi:biofilm PGA synthesis N-glycosyltransferase PgaC